MREENEPRFSPIVELLRASLNRLCTLQGRVPLTTQKKACPVVSRLVKLVELPLLWLAPYSPLTTLNLVMQIGRASRWSHCRITLGKRVTKWRMTVKYFEPAIITSFRQTSNSNDKNSPISMSLHAASHDALKLPFLSFLLRSSAPTACSKVFKLLSLLCSISALSVFFLSGPNRSHLFPLHNAIFPPHLAQSAPPVHQHHCHTPVQTTRRHGWHARLLFLYFPLSRCCSSAVFLPRESELSCESSSFSSFDFSLYHGVLHLLGWDPLLGDLI